jgi:hypothetical protein
MTLPALNFETYAVSIRNRHKSPSRNIAASIATAVSAWISMPVRSSNADTVTAPLAQPLTMIHRQQLFPWGAVQRNVRKPNTASTGSNIADKMTVSELSLCKAGLRLGFGVSLGELFVDSLSCRRDRLAAWCSAPVDGSLIPAITVDSRAFEPPPSAQLRSCRRHAISITS